jgi:hypothetical protein
MYGYNKKINVVDIVIPQQQADVKFLQEIG